MARRRRSHRHGVRSIPPHPLTEDADGAEDTGPEPIPRTCGPAHILTGEVHACLGPECSLWGIGLALSGQEVGVCAVGALMAKYAGRLKLLSSVVNEDGIVVHGTPQDEESEECSGDSGGTG